MRSRKKRSVGSKNVTFNVFCSRWSATTRRNRRTTVAKCVNTSRCVEKPDDTIRPEQKKPSSRRFLRLPDRQFGEKRTKRKAIRRNLALIQVYGEKKGSTVAQWLAQQPCSAGVLGSNPTQDNICKEFDSPNCQKFFQSSYIIMYMVDFNDKYFLTFKSLWVERTALTLVQSLPGISRWFEVEKREVAEMSPLENAIEVLENKNQQLRTLISQCQTRQMQNINPLTMCLNGVIDAAVNGGVSRYQEAFFVKEYIFNHPEDGDKISRLRELMLEQAQILEFGLAVHEKFVPQDMRPLHKKMVDQFFVLKSSLGIQDFSACVPPSPVNFHNGSPRIPRNSAPAIMGPDAARVVPRRSPLSYPAVNRYSSSSLSSQASAEVSNLTGQSESSDEVFHMQDYGGHCALRNLEYCRNSVPLPDLCLATILSLSSLASSFDLMIVILSDMHSESFYLKFEFYTFRLSKCDKFCPL
ncbi:unnamed protein product [Ranitomeya imitator]|uniref:DOCKER domain-containing protein n=1 Tax=Ranitomeya imitator TaxID=111125 RepID=A0ABN9LZQ6_9NEOB|nr:unnamed protein product [Ranitomeya imitator]